MRPPSYRLLGARGSGSAVIEALLTLVGVPFELQDLTDFDRPGPVRTQLLALNSSGRVPTLVLPDDTVLTESAAMVLHLAEAHPAAEVAPAAGTPGRARFLDRLIWIVANLYPSVGRADYPDRVGPTGHADIREFARAERQALWRAWEQALNDEVMPVALAMYVTVMTTWHPGRDWFGTNCPRLFAIARQAERVAKLAPVWRRHLS